MKFSRKVYTIILFLISLLIIILLIRYLYKNIEHKILLESFAASSTSPPNKAIDITGRKKTLIETVPLTFKNDGLVDNTDNYTINANIQQAGYPDFK